MLSKRGAPLYFQAEEYMREKILHHEWEVGSQIPTEPQLMELFGISRATLRQAVTNLVNEGFLERQQGRGTFVRNNAYSTIDLTGIWTERVPGEYHQPISILETVGPEKINNLLGRPSEKKNIEASYLHCLSNNVPFNLTITHFPVEQFPDIMKYLFSDTVYNILKKQYQVILQRVSSHISSVSLTEDQAKVLKLKPGTTAIYMEKTYYDTLGTPALVEEKYLHPRNFDIRIETALNDSTPLDDIQTVI